MIKRLQTAVWAAVASGFFCGVLLPEFFRMNSGSYAGLLSFYGLQAFAGTKLQPASLFCSVFPNRMAGILMLWMSCYTPVGLLFHLLLFFWLSLSFGILASVFLLRHGYHGILLLFASVLPQWILYLSVLKQEVAFLSGMRAGTALTAQAGQHDSGMPQVRRLGRMLLTGFTGCILETWFGLWVFRMLLHYV